MQRTLPIHWVKSQWNGSVFYDQFELGLVDRGVHDFLPEPPAAGKDSGQLRTGLIMDEKRPLNSMTTNRRPAGGVQR